MRLLGIQTLVSLSGNKPEFINTILERYKQVYLAPEGALKDFQFYFAQYFTKKIRTFFNEQQLNIQANATEKNVVWKVRSMSQSSPRLVLDQIFYKYGNAQTN